MMTTIYSHHKQSYSRYYMSLLLVDDAFLDEAARSYHDSRFSLQWEQPDHMVQ